MNSSSWWLNQPPWIIWVKLDHLPRGENKTYLKPPSRHQLFWEISLTIHRCQLLSWILVHRHITQAPRVLHSPARTVLQPFVGPQWCNVLWNSLIIGFFLRWGNKYVKRNIWSPTGQSTGIYTQLPTKLKQNSKNWLLGDIWVDIYSTTNWHQVGCLVHRFCFETWNISNRRRWEYLYGRKKTPSTTLWYHKLSVLYLFYPINILIASTNPLLLLAVFFKVLPSLKLRVRPMKINGWKMKPVLLGPGPLFGGFGRVLFL